MANKLFIWPLTMIDADSFQSTPKDQLLTFQPGATGCIIVDFELGAAASADLPHIVDPKAARAYYMAADTACHIRGHDSADALGTLATTSDPYMPASVPLFFKPGPDLQHISAIAAA